MQPDRLVAEVIAPLVEAAARDAAARDAAAEGAAEVAAAEVAAAAAAREAEAVGADGAGGGAGSGAGVGAGGAPPAAARRVVVVDIGAGTGYFALRLARACPGALIVATDTEPGMRAFVARAAAADAAVARARNLETAAATGAECGLAAGARADVALLAAVYHHLGDRVAYLRRLRERSLRPDARLVVVDHGPGPLPAHLANTPRPPPEMVLPRSAVVAEAQAAGFALEAAPSLLDGAAMYVLVFRPAAAAAAE